MPTEEKTDHTNNHLYTNWSKQSPYMLNSKYLADFQQDETDMFTSMLQGQTILEQVDYLTTSVPQQIGSIPE